MEAKKADYADLKDVNLIFVGENPYAQAPEGGHRIKETVDKQGQ